MPSTAQPTWLVHTSQSSEVTAHTPVPALEPPAVHVAIAVPQTPIAATQSPLIVSNLSCSVPWDGTMNVAVNVLGVLLVQYPWVNMHSVGFSASSPVNPGSHAQIRSLVVVPGVLVTALVAHVRTAVHDVLPREGM